MKHLIETPARGSIAEWLDKYEHLSVEDAADLVIELWPDVLEPLSYVEPGYGLTRRKLERLVRERRAKRIAQRSESEGLNASSEYPDV